MTKKQIRASFRNACFTRDQNRCVLCGATGELDAHHIVDRNDIPNGGYVAENGITVCKDCHWKAEQFHLTGKSLPGFAPDDLYRKIGSSKEMAVAAAKKLADVA